MKWVNSSAVSLFALGGVVWLAEYIFGGVWSLRSSGMDLLVWLGGDASSFLRDKQICRRWVDSWIALFCVAMRDSRLCESCVCDSRATSCVRLCVRRASREPMNMACLTKRGIMLFGILSTA